MFTNTTKNDWREKVYNVDPHHAEFSEAELLNLVKTTVKRKVFHIIRGVKTPPNSILHGVKALHALFGNFIEEPRYKMKYPWPWYQKLLKDIIPQVIDKQQKTNFNFLSL